VTPAIAIPRNNDLRVQPFDSLFDTDSTFLRTGRVELLRHNVESAYHNAP